MAEDPGTLDHMRAIVFLSLVTFACGGGDKKDAKHAAKEGENTETKSADPESGSGATEAVAYLARPSKASEFSQVAAQALGPKQFSISLEGADAVIDTNDEGEPNSAKITTNGNPAVSVSFTCKQEARGLFCQATRSEVKVANAKTSIQLELVRPKGKAEELESKLNNPDQEVKSDAQGNLSLSTLDMPISVAPGAEASARAVAADEARYSTIALSSRPKTVEVLRGATHIRIRRGAPNFDAIFKPMIAESKGACKYAPVKGKDEAKMVVCKSSGSSDRSLMVGKLVNDEPYVCYALRVAGKKEADDALKWCAGLH
jgi:hypothetical protein